MVSLSKLHSRGCVAVALVAALALAGCATPAANQTPEQRVAARADQRWQHLLAGRFDQAYALLTPAYRALHTAQDYRGTFLGAVKWRGVKIVNTTCEPEKCEVRVELTVVNPLARRPDDTFATHFSETWLLSEGDWYHYEKP